MQPERQSVKSHPVIPILACAFFLALLAPACGSETGGTGGSGGGTTTGQSCAAVTDCPAPPNECVERACEAGICAAKNIPAGSPATGQTSGNCVKKICAGGEILTVEDSADKPDDDGTTCTVEACDAGKPVSLNAAVGQACNDAGGKVCSGTGKCVECVIDAHCAKTETCMEQKCVSAACKDGMKDGSETDVDCGGSCGMSCDDGKACLADADCKNGHCADGVCCDKACDGACEACAAAKTGGSDGTCAPVSAGTDPDNECEPEPSVECGNSDGFCSGQAACNKVAEGTPCGNPGMCTSGMGTSGDACDGMGTCVPGKSTPCDPYVCDAAGCKTQCANNTDCIAGSFCENGKCVPILENGDSCANGGACKSGFCADGVCCDSACNGACKACTAAKKGTGMDGVCGGVKAGTDPHDDCPGTQVCDLGSTCKPPNGTPCADGSTCATGFCVDGVCCSAQCGGLCMACTQALTASAPDGTCAPNLGGTDPAAECAGPLVCSGMGTCTTLSNGALCNAPGDCMSGFCTDGVCCNSLCLGNCQACSATKKGSGQSGVCGNIAGGLDPDNECLGATSCDGNSGCGLLAAGQTCSQNAECGSGFCVDNVCCTSACGGACQACSQAKKGAGSNNGTCGPVAVGTDPDNECAGATVCDAAGTCKVPDSQSCSLGTDCVSGFCADGVCCNTACSGVCQACTNAKKGSGMNGVCGSIQNGADPDNECGGATVCNGSGACALLPVGAACAIDAECQSVACVDGYCCNTACTDACQACSQVKKGSGANGTCGFIGTGSDPDNECAGALVCNGAGLCKATNGGSCMANGDCLSALCADNVCCNTACSGTCQACSAAKKGSGADGVCGNIAAGSDPDSECPGAASCGGAGACLLLANGVTCSLNTECQSNQCVDGVCCNTSCTGLCQACTAAKKGSGADGTCGSVAVSTDPDNECPGATTCNGAACALFSNGTPCSLNTECQNGQCVDGVCCNSACGGLCQACSAMKKGAGADGSCGPIMTGTDPDNECAGAQSCNGAGACF